MRRTILVLLKYPEPGKVKTRLAAEIGAQRAADLYRDWLGLVFGQLQPLRGDTRIIAYFDDRPGSLFAEWSSLADAWWPQPEEDLGGRLEAGFQRAHALEGPVIAIGTDCLTITAALVEEAFTVLGNRSAIFGPVPDGGYYLVGTDRPLPGFFADIRWSSPHTLADHLARCQRMDWSTALLPLRHDIDTWPDWLAHCERQDALAKRGPSGQLSLAVVIPALNEEAFLAAALTSLLAQSAPAERLLVVDGGSRDGTVSVARSFGVDVLRIAGRGRGGQVNAGTAVVEEDVILVAHADMVFPLTALESVRGRLTEEPACPGGCLGHRFSSRKRIYRLIEWFDRRRGQRGESFGDQAQFFRRGRLARAGGFPDLPIMEDVELARRLRELGRAVYLDVPVTVSPRRFERRGWLRTAWANWSFRRAYRRHGQAACRQIYQQYYRHDGTATPAPSQRP